MQSDPTKKEAPPTKTPATMDSTASDTSGDANEGEGNRTAARRYDTATEKYIASGQSDAAARAAAEALDGPEGDALREAEKLGKAGHPKKSTP